MQIFYIMNNGNKHESIKPVDYILCKKNNGIILNNTIIKDLGDSINLFNGQCHLITNNYLYPTYI